MRKTSLLILVVALGCAGPTGIMADTDESSSGSSGTDGTDATTATTASTVTTTTASTTMTTDQSTSMATTTATTTSSDPDTSTTNDPSDPTTDAETGECIPGDLDCPCDIGSTCSGDLVCVDGTCVDEPACDEPEGEPNDDEASAVELPDVTCGGDAMTQMGAFDGAETDWFVYHAQDAIACFQNPNVVVTSDVDVGVCVFVDCDMGNTSVNCSGGSDEDTSPDGLDGCCDQNEVGLGDFSCQFNSPNASLYVRIVSLDAACVPYELAFDY